MTGIDLSPRLIAMARAPDPPEELIDYRVADLSGPESRSRRTVRCDRQLPGAQRCPALPRVRLVAGVDAGAQGGRVVLAFNNPYSSVVREHIAASFAETDAMGTYLGMWKQGIKARYYHRTLEEYLDAFLDTGLALVKLVDVPDVFGIEWILPRGEPLPSLHDPRLRNALMGGKGAWCGALAVSLAATRAATAGMRRWGQSSIRSSERGDWGSKTRCGSLLRTNS